MSIEVLKVNTKKMVDELGGEVGLYIKFLDTNEVIKINENL